MADSPHLCRGRAAEVLLMSSQRGVIFPNLKERDRYTGHVMRWHAALEFLQEGETMDQV